MSWQRRRGWCHRGVGTGPRRRPGVGSVTMGRTYDTVSLLTDYGLDDEFVGVVKAVLRDLAPHVTTIDLTHGVRPYDVRGGSLALARAISYVPEGVVLAVVDPGRRHGAAGDRRRGRRRRRRARRARQRPAGPGRGDHRRRRAGRRAHQPRLPPRRAGVDVRRAGRLRPGRRPPLQRRRPRRARPARRHRPADAGHGRPAPRGGRRHPRRGAVGRPVRQLPAQHRPRRARPPASTCGA